jgi:hypothetical protein
MWASFRSDSGLPACTLSRVPLQNAVTSHDLRILARRLRCPVVLVDDAAEDLAAPHRRVQLHDSHLVLVGWPLLSGLVRTVPVVAAPRGAALYRPRSGQGREEMSLDLMPNLAPKG